MISQPALQSVSHCSGVSYEDTQASNNALALGNSFHTPCSSQSLSKGRESSMGIS